MPVSANAEDAIGKRASSGPHTSHGASNTQVLRATMAGTINANMMRIATMRQLYDEPCCAIHTVTVNPVTWVLTSYQVPVYMES